MKAKTVERKPKVRPEKVRLTMTRAEARKLAAALETPYWGEQGDENSTFLEDAHDVLCDAIGEGWIGHSSEGFTRASVRHVAAPF